MPSNAWGSAFSRSLLGSQEAPTSFGVAGKTQETSESVLFLIYVPLIYRSYLIACILAYIISLQSKALFQQSDSLIFLKVLEEV